MMCIKLMLNVYITMVYVSGKGGSHPVKTTLTSHGKVISSIKLANAELFSAERLYIM